MSHVTSMSHVCKCATIVTQHGRKRGDMPQWETPGLCTHQSDRCISLISHTSWEFSASSFSLGRGELLCSDFTDFTAWGMSHGSLWVTRMFTVDFIVHADNKDSQYMGCAVNCGSNLKHGPSFCQFSAEEGAIRGNLDTYRRSRLSRLGYQEPTFHQRVSWQW